MHAKTKYTPFLLVIICMFIMVSNPERLSAQQSKIDSTLNYIKTAKDDTLKINALNNLSWELIKLGYYVKADSVAQIALKDAIKLNFKSGTADSYSKIAISKRHQGNYSDALKNQLAALKLFQEIGVKKYIATSFNSIGNIYLQIGNTKEALRNYLAALEISKSINDKNNISVQYTNLGLVYADLGNYPEALKNYFASLKIDEELGSKDPAGTASTYRNIGNVHMRLGGFNEARENVSTSLKICEQIGDKDGMAISVYSLGIISMKLKNFLQSKEYLTRALILAKETGNKVLIHEDYAALAYVDSASGNFNAAFEHYKLAVLYRDSLFNEENTKKLVQAQMNSDFEKVQEAAKLQQAKKDAVQQEEIHTQKIIRYSFTVGFALMFLLSIVVYRSYQQKQKANKALANKNELIQIQKDEVEHQKKLVDEKNMEITDGINYAKRIQTSFLTSEKYISQHFSDYFILYNPRNIVSGDFYWILEKEAGLYVCTADCTGHGIPGAFMSLIGIGILNEIFYSKNHLIHTDEFLNELRRIIILALNPQGAKEEGKDGMDAVLCRYDLKKMELEYSAANNSFYIIRKGELLEFKPDKMPIGKYLDEERLFSRTTISLEAGDCIYTFSDGYADQFGGTLGKKFKSKQLKEVLLANSHKPMTEQKKILSNRIKEWKGSLEQVDDILVMGIRV